MAIETIDISIMRTCGQGCCLMLRNKCALEALELLDFGTMMEWGEWCAQWRTTY
jgi:hypothetical protein